MLMARRQVCRRASRALPSRFRDLRALRAHVDGKTAGLQARFARFAFPIPRSARASRAC
jgi:hypothetical protein